MSHFTLTGDGERSNALKELETWKAEVEEATNTKDKLTLQGLQNLDAKTKAKEEMTSALEQQEKYREEYAQAMEAIEGDIRRLQTGNTELKSKLHGCKEFLELRRTMFTELTRKLKLSAQIADIKLKFSNVLKDEEENEASQHWICGLHTITQHPSTLLLGGQALITFEEKEVASQILRMAMCSVPIGHHRIDVKPTPLTLDSAVKFGIQLDTSRKELMFSGVGSTMTPEEVRHHLAVSFSRPSRGGGEVEKVEHDPNTGRGKVTFLNAGVADRLARIGEYSVDLDRQLNLKVESAFQYRLEKFQMFCSVPERTILLDNIRDVDEEDEMADTLEIFFQKPTNSGGEIESFEYVPGGRERLALFNVVPVNQM